MLRTVEMLRKLHFQRFRIFFRNSAGKCRLTVIFFIMFLAIFAFHDILRSNIKTEKEHYKEKNEKEDKNWKIKTKDKEDIRFAVGEVPTFHITRPFFVFNQRPWKIEKLLAKKQTYENNMDVRWSMVFVIKSALSHFHRRESIRSTWCATVVFKDTMFQCVFVVGKSNDPLLMQKAMEENNKFGDVLQYDYNDTARNVPEKVLAGMQWFSELPEECIYASVDDDILVSLPRLHNYFSSLLEKLPSNNGNIDFGNIPIVCVYSYQYKDIPLRNETSKWYVSMEQYSGKLWPIYCRGGMYTINKHMVKDLYKISRKVKHLQMDDVWITGLMRSKLKVNKEKIVAAPGSNLTEQELHITEWGPDRIVHHLWGNIEGKEEDISQRIKETWKSMV